MSTLRGCRPSLFDEDDVRSNVDLPGWSVTGRRGRKAKAPTVTNLHAAESDGSSSNTILTNNGSSISASTDKGKGIVTADEISEAATSTNNIGLVLNLDLRLGIGTECNGQTSNMTYMISSAAGRMSMTDIEGTRTEQKIDLELRLGIGDICSVDTKGKSVIDQFPEVGDGKAYVCKFCSKSFSKHEALGGHMTCHNVRKSKAAKDGPAEGCQSSNAGGARDEESTKLHECNVCHKMFRTGQQLGGHKRAHFEGTLGTSSSKRAKCGSNGSSSSGTAVVSDSMETNTSAASGSVVQGIDFNEMPPDKEE